MVLLTSNLASSWPYREMVFISKQSMPEPIIMNFRFSLEPSVTGTNFPQMHFRLKIWTCLKKTLSILPMSYPTTTNCYLLSAFILHYTNLVSSLFSPFLTNNTLHLFFLLPHTACKHLNRWKAIKPETWNLLLLLLCHKCFITVTTTITISNSLTTLVVYKLSCQPERFNSWFHTFDWQQAVSKYV